MASQTRLKANQKYKNQALLSKTKPTVQQPPTARALLRFINTFLLQHRTPSTLPLLLFVFCRKLIKYTQTTRTRPSHTTKCSPKNYLVSNKSNFPVNKSTILLTTLHNPTVPRRTTFPPSEAGGTTPTAQPPALSVGFEANWSHSQQPTRLHRQASALRHIALLFKELQHGAPFLLYRTTHPMSSTPPAPPF